MGNTFKIENASVAEEHRIVTGLVVNSEFCNKLQNFLDPKYFKNEYLKEIAFWCLEYYDEYKEAPNKYIKEIYYEKRKKIKTEKALLIKKVLMQLSNQYAKEEINVKYLLNLSLNYIKQRDFEITQNNVDELFRRGQKDEAFDLMDSYKVLENRISKAFYMKGVIDDDTNDRVYIKEKNRTFFQLPGDLGKYLGEFKRSELVCYFAAAKVGKTFVLLDHFKHAILQKRKVIFFSLEMNEEEVTRRVNKLFFPMIDEEGMSTYPAFDCVANQTGDCIDRASPVVILDDGCVTMHKKHVVCTKCMHLPHKYQETIVQMPIYREQEDIFTVRKHTTEKFKKMCNRYGRICIYPKYQLEYNDIISELDSLAVNENYIPDIIIIDYADILKFDTKHLDYKAEEERWKMLAHLGGSTNTLIITASQANKAALSAKTLDSTHQGSFYGKSRHVNFMCGLTQSAEEKIQGLLNFGITEARSKVFVQGQTCSVLQDIKAGQVHLESYCPSLYATKEMNLRNARSVKIKDDSDD